MVKFEFYLSDEDFDRMDIVKKESNLSELSYNDFAKELLRRELNRLHPEVPFKDEWDTSEIGKIIKSLKVMLYIIYGMTFLKAPNLFVKNIFYELPTYYKLDCCRIDLHNFDENCEKKMGEWPGTERENIVFVVKRDENSNYCTIIWTMQWKFNKNRVEQYKTAAVKTL